MRLAMLVLLPLVAMTLLRDPRGGGWSSASDESLSLVVAGGINMGLNMPSAEFQSSILSPQFAGDG